MKITQHLPVKILFCSLYVALAPAVVYAEKNETLALRSVKLLDGGESLDYSSTSRGVNIALPWQPRHEAATVLVMEIDGEPEDAPPGPDEHGTYHLEARDANLHGKTIRYPSDLGRQESIGSWV